MEEITIAELVKKGTMNSDMAALLWSAVDEKISFLTSALYQNAGKTTVSKAVLSLRPENVSLHYISDNPEINEKLLKLERRGGYLVVAEFSPADVPGYIWGEEVQKVFNALKRGYSLQASIHAESAEDAIIQMTQGNGINDNDASLVKLVLYIEMFGASYANVKRRVSQVYEVHYVENGKPVGHLLFTWDKNSDKFEKVSDSHEFARNSEDLKRRSEIIGELALLGRTSSSDVSDAVKRFREEKK